MPVCGIGGQYCVDSLIEWGLIHPTDALFSLLLALLGVSGQVKEGMNMGGPQRNGLARAATA